MEKMRRAFAGRDIAHDGVGFMIDKYSMSAVLFWWSICTENSEAFI
jgi:hypothetical protein